MFTRVKQLEKITVESAKHLEAVLKSAVPEGVSIADIVESQTENVISNLEMKTRIDAFEHMLANNVKPIQKYNEKPKPPKDLANKPAQSNQ